MLKASNRHFTGGTIIMTEGNMETEGNTLISRVQIYSSFNIITGTITREPGQRLLDMLNPSASTTYARELDFICISDVRVQGMDNKYVNLQSIFVNKSNIFFIRELEAGYTGESKSIKRMYPYVAKDVIGIKFYMPYYALTGKIHYPKGHHPEEVWTSQTKFFPLTEASIISLSDHIESQASFIAVNKDQVLYIEAIC